MLVSIALAASEKLGATETNDELMKSLKRGLTFDMFVSIAIAAIEKP